MKLHAAVMGACTLLLTPISLEAAKRPNVIFFLVDDLNYESLGCMGNDIVQTPVVDALAQSGCQFNNAYVTTSISMASRASIFTGMYMCRHGVTQYLTATSVAAVEEVYPRQLQLNGYNTGFIGKFGFRIEGGLSPESWFDYYQPIDRPPMITLDERGRELHSTDLTTQYALEYIKDRSKSEPFVLSVSYHAVHADDNDHTPGRGHFPYSLKSEHLYEDAIIPSPDLDDPQIFENHPKFLQESMNRERYFWRWDTPEKYDTNVKAYYRMISDVDRSIGEVQRLLKRRGLSDNTIIVLMSDNGFYMGERGFAGKWSHFEESLRVPLIIFDPRSSAQHGVQCDQMVLNVDIPSTILDWCGVDVPMSYQGESLVPITRGDEKSSREEFYCEHGSTVPSIPRWRGVKGARFKYASYYDKGYEFLYDLESDPEELVNLAEDPAFRNILLEYREKCQRYFQKYSK